MPTTKTDNFANFTTDENQNVTLRPLNKDDVELLIDLFQKLSPEAKRLRFHANVDHVDDEVVRQEAERLAGIDPQEQFALLALDETNGTEEAVGVARFDRLPADESQAEVAIVVRDDFQSQGLGRYLLETLTQVAHRQNIERFVLLTTTDNTAMLKLTKDVWSSVEVKHQRGEQEIWVTLR